VNEEPSSLVLNPDPLEAGKRLDAYLAENIPGWSRSRLQRLVENEDILVNEKKVKPSYKIRMGDEVEVDLVEVTVDRFEPEDIPLDIVHEDEYLAVINKPAGMVVHPGAGVQSGTLANAIAFHFSLGVPASAGLPPKGGTPNEARIGIVHRLDKDTSGLIVVAKTDKIHEALSEQFRSREVYKSYMALVHGSPEQNTGKIDAPIGRNKHNRLRMKVAAYGRSALSLWKVQKAIRQIHTAGCRDQDRPHAPDTRPYGLHQSPRRRRRDLQRRPRQHRRRYQRPQCRRDHASLFPPRRKAVIHPPQRPANRKEFVQELPGELSNFLTLL
jgi:23S rRNA pseudouridine1911/1915/1917 synthase